MNKPPNTPNPIHTYNIFHFVDSSKGGNTDGLGVGLGGGRVGRGRVGTNEDEIPDTGDGVGETGISIGDFIWVDEGAGSTGVGDIYLGLEK